MRPILSGFGKILSGQFDAYFNVVRDDPCNVRMVFDIFNRSRILCAVREGPYGVNAVNRLLANAILKMQADGNKAGKTFTRNGLPDSRLWSGETIMS